MTYDQSTLPRGDNSIKPKDLNEAALDAIWDELGKAEASVSTEKDMTTIPMGVEADEELAADLVIQTLVAASKLIEKL